MPDKHYLCIANEYNTLLCVVEREKEEKLLEKPE